MIESCEKEQVNEICAYFNNLNEQLGFLNETVSVLGTKMQPVLRLACPTDEKKAIAANGENHSPLAASLIDATQYAKDIRRRLIDIIDRTELL